jgi:hypothetical protein
MSHRTIGGVLNPPEKPDSDRCVSAYGIAALNSPRLHFDLESLAIPRPGWRKFT